MPHEFLHAKIRVGSCKNASVNYKKSAHVFHHDDVPAWARDRVKDMKDYKASKILKIDHFPWDRQSKLDRPVYDKPCMSNFRKDRGGAMQYNYRAEVNGPTLVAPVDKPTKFHISTTLTEDAIKTMTIMRDDPLQRGRFFRTQEMPTHPKLQDAIPWDSSSKQNDNLRNSFFTSKGEKAKRNTRRVNKELEHLDYIPPIKQAAAVTKRVRKLKRDGSFTLENALSDPKQNVEEAITYHNRQALEGSRKYTHHTHSGVYEFNKTEGRYMWSDTGSYVEEATGDIVHSYNPDGYNYVGPTLAPAPGFQAKEKRINLIERGVKKNVRYGLDGEVLPQAF